MDESTAFIAIGILSVAAMGLFFLSARNWTKAKFLQAAAGIDAGAKDKQPSPPRPRNRRLPTSRPKAGATHTAAVAGRTAIRDAPMPRTTAAGAPTSKSADTEPAP